MELIFSIDQHPARDGRVTAAVSRWFRAFAMHDASLASKPAPFTVRVHTDDGRFVKGFPTNSREHAEALRTHLQAELASLGVRAFLVRHDAPTQLLARTGGSS
jgi:hypothetical protein